MNLLTHIPESAFQRQVEKLAWFNRWLVYHTYDSRRSHAGFPDLTMVRDGRLVFAELKTQKGKMSEPQKKWQRDLLRCSCEYYLWRPENWDEIEEVLK